MATVSAPGKLFVPSGIFYPESGGPATYLHELLPELHRRGWGVHALTFSDDARTHGESYPVTRILRQTYPLRMAKYALASRAPLHWADLVYAHQLGLPLVGSRRAPRAIKIVGDISWERAVRKGWVPPNEDIDVFQTRRYGLAVEVDKWRNAREARTYDRIIVPSEYLKRMVVGWGVAEARVQVIYNALPPAALTTLPTQEATREQLHLPDAPLVLAVGRILPWKGVDHLAAALASMPDVRLLVAGTGPALPAAQAAAEQAGVTDRVTFLGNVSREQMPLYMRAADYVALYSGYEGLSHTLLESLRVGTPLIASDKGGNPEVVADGVNGLLVPYTNATPAAYLLAETLQRAFAPGQRDALAAHAGDNLDRFTFSRMVNETDKALRAVL